jgi:hypothetical protein
MILNFESCYKRSISGRLLGDYVIPTVVYCVVIIFRTETLQKDQMFLICS